MSTTLGRSSEKQLTLRPFLILIFQRLNARLSVRITYNFYGPIVQLAPPDGGVKYLPVGGRERQIANKLWRAISSVVERQTDNLEVEGPIPSSPTRETWKLCSIKE